MSRHAHAESRKAGSVSRPRTEAIRVLLADDHAILRHGLKALLENQRDFRVIGEAANGREAVRRARELRPDVIVMDIAMPELNGIEAAARIREQLPAARIVMLSMYATSEFLRRALQAGACGYVVKRSASDELVKAVRAAHGGQRYFSPFVKETLIEEYVRQGSSSAETAPLDRLSPREREVLQLVVEGQSSAAIARKLSLSKPSVQTYRSRIMQKLGIHDLPGLIRFAIAHGITTAE